MKNGMFNREDFRKVQDLYEDFVATDVGNYIDNWVKGILLISFVVLILYILACFFTWSILPVPPDFEGSGILCRVVLTLYSFGVLVNTFGEGEDY
jgi:hypothetical protein